eukprot:352239-Chlamydomonas_euryale.AAC.18
MHVSIGLGSVPAICYTTLPTLSPPLHRQAGVTGYLFSAMHDDVVKALAMSCSPAPPHTSPILCTRRLA